MIRCEVAKRMLGKAAELKETAVQASQAARPEPGRQPEHAPAGGPRWKTREEYNAYMREYMRAWRAKK